MPHRLENILCLIEACVTFEALQLLVKDSPVMVIGLGNFMCRGDKRSGSNPQIKNF